ncbi:MAG: hypothetical protein WCJ35_20400 [Planctomycetota bacterium]
MRKIVWIIATVVAVVVLPQTLAAEESKTPGPPGPEMQFRLLDANHDGVISEDEIPAGAPEPLKSLLKAADKKGDKKVTPMSGFHGFPSPAMALDARLSDLEAKLKALEAKQR